MTAINPDDWIELGHGVSIVFTSWNRHDKAGLIHNHPRPDNGQQCAGGIMFDLPGVRDAFPDRELWMLARTEPLTITPSLLCSECGSHGWITDGVWVPC